jgi:hypothetical protein
MYGVHIKSFNRSMFTGRMTEEEMLHEHPLELADIKAGVAERPLDEAALRRRQRVFLPIAGALALFMLLGVYGFVNAEQSALTTIPRRAPTTVVFVPWTPTPAPTMTPTLEGGATVAPVPSGALTWDDTIGPMLQAKCTTCHGAGALGGLNLSTYEDAIRGGTSGEVILPGDSANSLLVQIQQSGDHPAVLTPEELAQVIEWIDAGAPEN